MKKVEVKEEDNSGPSRAELIQQTIDSNVSDFLGEFEGLVDEFILTSTNPNIQALITSMGVSSRAVPKIVEYANMKQEYYTSILDDKEALEYYSFSKPTIKKIAALYEQLVEKLSQNKKVRKTRVRKEKSAGVIVKNLKYQIKDDVLNLRSKPVADIVGADELYLYNTEKRKLQFFKAVDGEKLTVKGTTILNYDEKKSHQKNIRKPEELIQPFTNSGKIDSRRLMKNIVAKESGVNGRTSEHTIILNIFK